MKKTKRIPIYCCIALFIAMLIPSKQDTALMVLYPSLKSGVTNAANSSVFNKFKEYLDAGLEIKIKEARGGSNVRR